MKVQIKVIDPNTLSDNAGICGLDPESFAVADRVELDGSDTQTHLGVKDARQGFEVEEKDEENEAAEVPADHGLMGPDMLKVERDEVGGVLQHGCGHAHEDLVHGGWRHGEETGEQRCKVRTDEAVSETRKEQRRRNNGGVEESSGEVSVKTNESGTVEKRDGIEIYSSHTSAEALFHMK